jgi:hypothetical protein
MCVYTMLTTRNFPMLKSDVRQKKKKTKKNKEKNTNKNKLAPFVTISDEEDYTFYSADEETEIGTARKIIIFCRFFFIIFILLKLFILFYLTLYYFISFYLIVCYVIFCHFYV